MGAQLLATYWREYKWRKGSKLGCSLWTLSSATLPPHHGTFPNDTGRMLETVLQNLAAAEISVGRLYYDYKPANTVFDQGILHLIDPPDTLREGIHLWDVALFRSSMRRHLWRYTLRHPLACERRTATLAAIRAFQQSYVAALPGDGASQYFDAIVSLPRITTHRGAQSIGREMCSALRERVLRRRLVAPYALVDA